MANKNLILLITLCFSLQGNVLHGMLASTQNDELKKPKQNLPITVRLSELEELKVYGRIPIKEAIFYPDDSNAYWVDTIPFEYQDDLSKKEYSDRLAYWHNTVEEFALELTKNPTTKIRGHVIKLLGHPEEKGGPKNASTKIVDALHAAVIAQSPNMVTLLLERGAQKDWKDHLNRIPAYYIHRIQDESTALKIAQLVVTNKEDVEKTLNWMGETVVTLAQQAKKEKLFAYYKHLATNS